MCCFLSSLFHWVPQDKCPFLAEVLVWRCGTPEHHCQEKKKKSFVNLSSGIISIAVLKYRDQSITYRRKGFASACKSRLEFIAVGMSRQGLNRVSHIKTEEKLMQCTHTCLFACAQLYFPTLIELRTLSREWCPPTVGWIFPHHLQQLV